MLRSVFPGLVLVALGVAGCGGGGGVTPPANTQAPSASPTAMPTNVPAGGSPAICPAPSGTMFPMAIQNNTGISGAVTVYAWGQNPANTAQWFYLTSPTTGALAPLPSSGQVPSFTLPANGCIDLPPLVSARVYLVLGSQTINITSNGSGGGVNAPDPWNVARVNNASTVNAVWDFLEYTWYGPPGTFGMDTTQVDAIGIPISFQAVNSNGTPAASPLYGMKANAIKNLEADLTTLGSPWTGLIQQTGTAGASRVISPQHAANIPTDQPTPPSTPTPSPAPPVPNAPTFNPTFYDAIIAQIWSTYQGSNALYLSYPGQISAAYGVVDPNTKVFNFYPTSMIAGAPMAQIAYPTTWAVLNNAGAFANQSGSTPAVGAANAATFIGRALVVGIERGTLPLPSGAPAGAQPLCGMSDWMFFYGGSATNSGMTPTSGVVTNWYSALMHKYGQAPTPGLPGLAYAFPDDDECQLPNGHGQYDPYWAQSYTPGEQWSVTLNPL